MERTYFEEDSILSRKSHDRDSKRQAFRGVVEGLKPLSDRACERGDTPKTLRLLADEGRADPESPSAGEWWRVLARWRRKVYNLRTRILGFGTGEKAREAPGPAGRVLAPEACPPQVGETMPA